MSPTIMPMPMASRTGPINRAMYLDAVILPLPGFSRLSRNSTTGKACSARTSSLGLLVKSPAGKGLLAPMAHKV
jgi:hypothetical protein